MPARIAEAGNTQHRFALGLLAHRGFVVVRSPDAEAAEIDELWAMHPDGTILVGSSGLVLVGLLAILDELGDDWYTAPRVELPKGKTIDLAPEALARVADADLPATRDAFRRFAAISGWDVPCGDTREELVEAARNWLVKRNDD
jgi:hypothetical protein